MAISFPAVPKLIGSSIFLALGLFAAVDSAPLPPKPTPTAPSVSRSASLFEWLGARHGVRFSLAPGLDRDFPSGTPTPGNPAELWSILADYNYIAIADAAGKTRHIIVSSRKHDADETAPRPPGREDLDGLLYYEPGYAPLPARYQDFPPGSVVEISLRAAVLADMATGATLALALPTGRFQVVYETRADRPDGGFTWYGRLGGGDGSHWVILDLGGERIQGRIETPAGIYTIDSALGRQWLIGDGFL